MAESNIVVRVDDELKTAFAEAAKAADRTASQLLRDFMRDFVRRQSRSEEYESWFRAKVEAGLKAAEEGRVTAAEEAERLFSKRRAETQRKLARSAR